MMATFEPRTDTLQDHLEGNGTGEGPVHRASIVKPPPGAITRVRLASLVHKRILALEVVPEQDGGAAPSAERPRRTPVTRDQLHASLTVSGAQPRRRPQAIRVRHYHDALYRRIQDLRFSPNPVRFVFDEYLRERRRETSAQIWRAGIPGEGGQSWTSF